MNRRGPHRHKTGELAATFLMRPHIDLSFSAWMRILGALFLSLLPALMTPLEEGNIIAADLPVSKDYGVTTPMVKAAALKDLTEADVAKMLLEYIRLQSRHIIV